MFTCGVWHYPFRYAAAKFARVSALRKCSIGIIKGLIALSPGIPSCVREVRPLDDPGLCFAPTDSMVVEAVYWFGVRGYEGIMSEVWKRLCANSTSVLEVGANVGLFSVLGASQRPGIYTVVEPIPNVADTLRTNLGRNKLDFVEVLEGAATPSESLEEVKISIPDEGREAPVGSHMLEGVELKARSELKVVTARAYSIASLIKGRDLVKIDAEGIEAQLLIAVRETLLDKKPTLVVEVLPEAEKLGAILSEIAVRAGYRIYVVPEYGSDALVPIPPAGFSSKSPQKYNSKDVLLTMSDAKLLGLQVSH